MIKSSPESPAPPLIATDGGDFGRNAALLRAEIRLYAEIAERNRLRIDPRAFVITSIS